MRDDDPVELPTRKFRVRIPMPLAVGAIGFVVFGVIAVVGGMGGHRGVSGEQRDNRDRASDAASGAARAASRDTYLRAIAAHARRCPAGTTQKIEPSSHMVHLSCTSSAGPVDGTDLFIDLEGHPSGMP